MGGSKRKGLGKTCVGVESGGDVDGKDGDAGLIQRFDPDLPALG